MKIVIITLSLLFSQGTMNAQAARSELRDAFDSTYKNVYLTNLDEDSVYFTANGAAKSINLKFIEFYHLSIKDTVQKIGIFQGLGLGILSGFLFSTYVWVEDSTVRIKEYVNALPVMMLIGSGLGLVVGIIGELVNFYREPVQETDREYKLVNMKIAEKRQILLDILTVQNEYMVKVKGVKK